MCDDVYSSMTLVSQWAWWRLEMDRIKAAKMEKYAEKMNEF